MNNPKNLTTLVEYRGTKEFRDISCEICGANEEVRVFGVQSYALEPDEFISLCKKHETALRSIGTGAFHFKTLAIEALRTAFAGKNDERV